MRRVWLLLAIGLVIAIDTGPLSPQAVTGTEKLADYQWLLHSLERLELSGATDSYLMRRYESSSEEIPPQRRESPSRPEISFSSVKRVNDPSKDFPDATTQSELVPSLSDNRPRASIAVSASPNPVTSPYTTEFRVTDNEVVSIQLQIFDLAGRRVFHSGEIPDLTYRWHLDRDDGKTVSAGVYLYRVLATTIAGEKILSELKKIVARR